MTERTRIFAVKAHYIPKLAKVKCLNRNTLMQIKHSLRNMKYWSENAGGGHFTLKLSRLATHLWNLRHCWANLQTPSSNSLFNSISKFNVISCNDNWTRKGKLALHSNSLEYIFLCAWQNIEQVATCFPSYEILDVIKSEDISNRV